MAPQGIDAEDKTAPSSQITVDATPATAEAPRGAGPLIGERPGCFKNTFQEVVFVFMACMAMATTSFLTGACTVVTASLGRDLGMTQSEISWITASVSLTAGAFQLALGQLADLLGRKLTFIVGLASFSACAVLLGFAQNPFWLDVVLGLMGISSAMVVPPAVGILGAAYDRPSKRKNLAFSAFSAGNPLGFVLGSIVSGIASKLFNWRASFWFLAILWGLFTVVAFYAVPDGVEAFQHHEPLKVRLAAFSKRFDTVGAVLTLFGTGLFTASLTLGPSMGWKSAEVLGMMIAGILLIVVFVLWERTYPYPLMPLHIWKDRNFTFILISALFGFMSFSSSSFWLSYFLQEVKKLSPLSVAVHLMPQAIAGLIWNVIAGNILHRVNNTLIMAIGALAYLVANLLLSLMKMNSLYWAFIFPSLVIQVTGADFQFNVANMYVMQSLPSHQQSLAGGIFNTMVRLSSSVSMGITTAVFTSTAITPEGLANPLLQYTRSWYTSVGLAAAGLLFIPFIRLGTQGNFPREEKSPEGTGTDSPVVLDEKPAGLDAKQSD